MKFTQEEMIAAMQNDDASYDGKFFVCVKTTKIYCLPSCKAKLPMMKNVVFVETREEAIAAGFRGCKRCRSEFYPNTQPPWLDSVLATIKQNTTRKLDEQLLATTGGVDISTIRRYFKSYMNTTPMAMHRRVRLEYAHSLMRNGSDYLTAAYETGFESSSGFRDAFIKQYGHPPGRINGR
ncbi:MAG: methylphosphotriester-DNA--protein-cysteine methyltransferase family protein [Bacteroidetes bacterium]|nr:methylphosphotriester-DNA--protein-cysteine methyltransferase family protein [Bacteroidota bacterium]MCW5896575.1 methylphosphotriester-DNA--protein-cysteine methyltransferase family protein [Bacteroidota bacterium]